MLELIAKSMKCLDMFLLFAGFKVDKLKTDVVNRFLIKWNNQSFIDFQNNDSFYLLLAVL